MGVSTSASLLVIFVGVFVALGTVYTAGSTAVDRVNDAGSDRVEHHTAIQETRINVTSAEYDSGTLTVRVNNTGSTALSVNGTDMLVDGAYVSLDDFTATVDGESTDSWDLEQQLVLQTDSFGTAPDRVKVVTEVGIAGTARVEVIG
jgi:flagellar protein FlaF